MKNLSIIFLLLISANCFAQTKNFIDQNYIEVTGQAEMEISPDEIYLRIFVNEKDLKAKETLTDVEQKIINTLKDIGVNISEDFAIVDMASNLKNYWIKSSKIISTKEYQLRVGDARMTGRVFKRLNKIGVSNIIISKIENSKIERYKQEVKVLAIKAAKQKADAIASAIDQQAGKAIYIQEVNHRMYRRSEAMASELYEVKVRKFGKESTISQPEVEFKKIKLEYSILARFELN